MGSGLTTLGGARLNACSADQRRIRSAVAQLISGIRLGIFNGLPRSLDPGRIGGERVGPLAHFELGLLHQRHGGPFGRPHFGSSEPPPRSGWPRPVRALL